MTSTKDLSKLCHPQNASTHSLTAQCSCKQQKGEDVPSSSVHSSPTARQMLFVCLVTACYILSLTGQKEFGFIFRAISGFFVLVWFKIPPTFSLHFFSRRTFEILTSKASCLLCNSPKLNTSCCHLAL